VWTLPLSVLVALVALPCHPLAAIHAAAHALLRVLPQLLLCDAGDLDTEHSPSPLCTAPRPGVLVLNEPVECGLAAAACARAPALVSAARQLLQRCPCPLGCFDCLQSRGCTLSSCKAGAMLVLRSLQAEA
jgi:DEAD/DEAH box helicase domain-containing protein